MIGVRWRDVFGRWHERTFGHPAAALAFIKACGADPAVRSVVVLAATDDALFWDCVDAAMGFVGHDV